MKKTFAFLSMAVFFMSCATTDTSRASSSNECQNNVPAIGVDVEAEKINKQYISSFIKYIDDIRNNDNELTNIIGDLKKEQDNDSVKELKRQKKELNEKKDRLEREFENKLEEFGNKPPETQEAIIRKIWEMAKADTVAECDKMWGILLNKHFVQKAWEFSPNYLLDYTVHRWRLENANSISKLPEWKDDCFVFASRYEFGRLYRGERGGNRVVESLKNNNPPNGKSILKSPKEDKIPNWRNCKKRLEEGKNALKPVYRWKSSANSKEYLLAMVTLGKKSIALLPREVAEDAGMKIGGISSGIDFVCYSSVGTDGEDKQLTSITPEFFFNTIFDQLIALGHNYYIVANWYGVKEFTIEIKTQEDKKFEAVLNARTPKVFAEISENWHYSEEGYYVNNIKTENNKRKKGPCPITPFADRKLRNFADILERTPGIKEKDEEYKLKENTNISLKLEVSLYLGIVSVKGKFDYERLMETSMKNHCVF